MSQQDKHDDDARNRPGHQAKRASGVVVVGNARTVAVGPGSAADGSHVVQRPYRLDLVNAAALLPVRPHVPRCYRPRIATPPRSWSGRLEVAGRWCVRLTLLLVVLMPIVGCGAADGEAETTVSTANQTGFAGEHEQGHHEVCERATASAVMSGSPLRSFPDPRSIESRPHTNGSVLAPSGRPSMMSTASPTTSSGSALLLLVGITRC